MESFGLSGNSASFRLFRRQEAREAEMVLVLQYGQADVVLMHH